jgi:hypothetical protein
LYVTTIAEAVSMVLITEQPEPPHPQETKEASANGSGSQDLEPAGSSEVGVAAGSHLPEASTAPESQARTHDASRSQLLEAGSGPGDLEATTPRPPRHFWISGATSHRGPM